MILFGLAGGLGNQLFALPTLKALSRLDTVDLFVDGDHDTAPLWSRCRYVRRVYGAGNRVPGTYWARFSGDFSPRENGPWKRCGWPRPANDRYPRPEWAQIKKECLGNEAEEDVSDWIDLPREKEIDFALIPGCKPGDEWSRKKWGGFRELATALESRRFSVEAFGLRDEIGSAGLDPWWTGDRDLLSVAERLSKVRVASTTDSGIGHLASSLGVGCVFLFTATNPTKGRPLGPHKIIARGCERAPKGCQSTPLWKECTDHRCRAIPVEEVMNAAVSLLPTRIQGIAP